MFVVNGARRNQIYPMILTLKSPVNQDSTKEVWLNSKAYLDHHQAPVSRCSLSLHHIKVTNNR